MKDLTKKAIAEALKELLLEKSLSKITINDIAKKAQINRQTFYYHFRDIIELVEWVTIEDADKVLSNKTSYDSWQEGFLAIFDIIKQDKPFIMNIYNCVSLDILNTYLYKLVFPVIYKVVDEKAANFQVSEEDKIFITDFYKYAFVALVLEWIKGGMTEDPEKIVTRVSILLEGTIAHSLENLGKKIR